MKLSHLKCGLATSVFALVSTLPALADGGGAIPKHVEKEITSKLEETPAILSAPPPDARRVYVTDPADFAVAGRILTIDGNKAKLLATTDTGIVPNPVVASDGKFFAVAGTVFSRVSHGKRDDYIEVYDAQSHNVIADIDIPEVRMLVNTYPWMTALTPDNKNILLYQFSPSPGVGLVDLEAKKFVKMMDVPDCYHVFPVSSDTFYMHCREGHMLKATFDKDGNITTTKTKVLNPEDKHVINTPAFSEKAKRLVWPTYDGTIYQVDFTGGDAKFLDSFEAFTADEKAEGWAQGGWVTVAYHRPSDQIYLLADQRAKWTHKYSSRFVFVYDAKTGKRLNKIALDHEINSIAVSSDDNPQLYGISSHDRTLYIYDAKTGKQTSKVGELGQVPLIVTTTD
ncbi:methylamine dehydrogenase (amicyanin) large subunit [Hyphomicrobium sp. 99]|uniref:methylamine dehydrogenase (amicyanin) large subunit n=1 Tax=Hyphomicrobium sp. 99 TaxID=1163419 RepID=UPI0005F7BA23|nr:methylamine dehydrogenase (amicyanin) large subunit [Hyphomicrobium sp. 99]